MSGEETGGRDRVTFFWDWRGAEVEMTGQSSAARRMTWTTKPEGMAHSSTVALSRR